MSSDEAQINPVPRTRVGVIGCGKISGIYLKNMTTLFKNLEVVACADLDLERARSQAKEYGVRKACTPSDLLADPSIQLVVNLTIPAAHASVNEAILRAGKHLYVEKPLGTTREEGGKILELARELGLRVGCAPDTVLGGGIQLCRKILEDGVLGEIASATAFMAGHGPESWHPDPEFYYKRGAGPMLDMGPYYLTALVNLIGPIRRVAGFTGAAFRTRMVTSQPKAGTVVQVEIPTHYAGSLEFRSGALGSLVMSFDTWKHSLPRIELHGTKGSMSVPDPNTFGGPVKIFLPGMPDWQEIPAYTHGYTENSRGLGVADLADALVRRRPHRTSGELALHVLDAMLGFEEAAHTGRAKKLGSTCRRPEPLPIGTVL